MLEKIVGVNFVFILLHTLSSHATRRDTASYVNEKFITFLCRFELYLFSLQAE